MPVEDAADRAAMLSPDDWGQAYTWQPPAGDPVTLTGIPDQAYEATLDTDQGPRLEDSAPVLTLDSAAAAPIERGDTITRTADGARFAVREFQPDGTGITLLVLQALPPGP